MSSEWISAQEAREMGLVWRLCAPEDLMAEATAHATRLAALPVSSLRAVKRAMTEPHARRVAEARQRENRMFAELLGGPANNGRSPRSPREKAASPRCRTVPDCRRGPVAMGGGVL